MNSIHKYESISFLVLFVGVSILLFFVFAPFLSILSLAAVFAVLSHPLYERFITIFRGQKNLAAVVTLMIVLVFFITPIFFLGLQIFKEAQSLYGQAYGNGDARMYVIQNAIEAPVQRIFPRFSIDVNSYATSALTFIANNLASLVTQTFYVTLETLLMLLAFFFLLRDGRDILNACTRLSPFGPTQTNEILVNMYQTMSSVVKGTLFVGLIRWLLVGVSFYMFGIPNAILWGSIGGIVGIIPGLGTPFVFIPAVIYLYLEGSILPAIGLASFGIGAILLLDNILTPYFFGKGLHVSPIFVLFAILGGIIFFGPIGFVLGPLVFSVFLSVLHIYSTMVRQVRTPRTKRKTQ